MRGMDNIKIFVQYNFLLGQNKMSDITLPILKLRHDKLRLDWSRAIYVADLGTAYDVTSGNEGIPRLKFNFLTKHRSLYPTIIPYPTAFPYGNGMVLHFYQQQESSTTKTVHKVINKRLKAYV